MQQKPKSWLSAAVIVTLLEFKSILTLKLEWLSPEPVNAVVAVSFLDRHWFEPGGTRGKGGCPAIPNATVPIVTPATGARAAETQRVLGCRKLLGGSNTVVLPADAFRQASYIGLSVQATPTTIPDCVGEAGHAEAKHRLDFDLEFSRRRLQAQRGRGQRYWLLTEGQRNDRVEAIGNKYHLFDRNDAASTETLVKLLFGINGGEDGPLLTEDL